MTYLLSAWCDFYVQRSKLLCETINFTTHIEEIAVNMLTTLNVLSVFLDIHVAKFNINYIKYIRKLSKVLKKLNFFMR